ncbi:coiled-coil domain-containing protein 82 [Ambystoma mexicanum]|uniref:coiled-coil domain-containing protein 82 n=1 Tax=Ambystoma mexicanum TaxID=8296 RepID=UPI0037E8E4B3
MSTETVQRSYETRRKTRSQTPTSKSRVDWKRTKRDLSQLLESGDDDCSSEDLQTEELNSSPSSTTDDEEHQPNKPLLQKEDTEEECITARRRKKMTSILCDNSSSSDEEEPVRKVSAKRRSVMQDESTDDESKEKYSSVGEGEYAKEADSISSRKLKRQVKLTELSQKRSNALKSTFHGHNETADQESFPFPLTPNETSDPEEDEDDNGSLSSFIVQDEDEPTGDSENGTQSSALSHHALFLQHHIPLVSDHFVHFQRIVRAFLINALDDTFLNSLFDGTRQKRYAKEMMSSLNHLDERIIAPRLENLKSRSRWKEQYKERVESYPFMQISRVRSREAICQACGLTRYISFEVTLSGESYKCKTLESDDFMQHDRQVLKVGTICAERSRVYHQLKHFKYNLLKQCLSIAQFPEKDDEMPVKDTVDLLFSRLEGSWIQREYDILERYLNEADYFQEEMMS